MADDQQGEAAPDDDRDGIADGVEHLQAAAKEVIRAGRSLLDAAEGLIDDPSALQGLVGTLGALAQAAARSLQSTVGGAGDAGDGDDDDDGKVQRIRVS